MHGGREGGGVVLVLQQLEGKRRRKGRGCRAWLKEEGDKGEGDGDGLGRKRKKKKREIKEMGRACEMK